MTDSNREPEKDATATERKVGRDGQPIRAIAFAAGAADTAMQLGVIHALLVSRSEAPDAVVGISAGAINAVALADILQTQSQEAALAGPGAGETSPQRDAARASRARLEARTHRFRTIYEAFLSAPGQLVSKLIPDSYQIDAATPLEPLDLPIHAEAESQQRGSSLGARSGLIHLYNQMLRVELSVGALTRTARRVVGLRAAAEATRHSGLIALGELLRLWILIGAHLGKVAPIAHGFAWAQLVTSAERERGSSAGEIIFRSELWRATVKLFSFVTWLLLLSNLWLLATAVALAVLAALVLVPAWLASRISFGLGVTIGALAFSGLTIPLWPAPKKTVVRVASGLLGWLTVRLCVVAAGVGVIALPLFLLERTNAWPLTGSQTVMLVAGFYAIFTLLGVGIAIKIFGSRRTIWHRILQRNGIAASLLDPNPLREILIELFDPDYYGRMNLDEAVDCALGDDDRRPVFEGKKKKMGDFESATPPIAVGTVAADLQNRELLTLPPTAPVVDALLAATARVPLFPAQSVMFPADNVPADNVPVDDVKEKPPERQRYLVDGATIANEPIRSAITFLRHKVNDKSSALHIYTVSPLPVESQELSPDPEAASARGESTGGYEELVDVVARALELQRFRDSGLERGLTQLCTDVIPEDAGLVYPLEDGASPSRVLKALIAPIEPDRPIGTNRKILSAADETARRKVVGEAVATGCRLALEAMIPVDIRRAWKQAQPGANEPTLEMGPHAEEQPFVTCRKAIAHRVGAVDPSGSTLPGAAARSGPGVSEVCQHCTLSRPSFPDLHATLRVGERRDAGGRPIPPWPLEGRGAAEDGAPTTTQTVEVPVEQGDDDHDPTATFDWPRPGPNGAPGAQRPVVSFLFSGGVFRGVFQVGVLSALSDVGLRPDIVAGASVGSIVGAMAAAAFSHPERDRQATEIARVAATFLAMDRLVLTDRLADFARELTVRAAQSRFSLRDLDRTFRQYDRSSGAGYSAEARRVLAGLERLLYLSPFEVATLVKAVRVRDWAGISRATRDYFQELLARYGVADQILGAEPLRLLIQEHVERRLPGLDERAPKAPGSASFDAFARHGIHLLSTATNLTRGRLEILSSEPFGNEHRRAFLIEGLLASSAFPAIFRPRWSWEIFANAEAPEMYIDGGVMDNLPLDAVAHFLDHARQKGQIARRPRVNDEPVPHLIFAASLQIDPVELKQAEAQRIVRDWPALRKRAKSLSYNDKVDVFQSSQRVFRRIYDQQARNRAREPGAGSRSRRVPLDLEPLVIKPRWLCDTFAFHPMLGFRRENQARSIAHGCARTLFELAQKRAAHETWTDAWGIDPVRLPVLDETTPKIEPKVPEVPGGCWWRPKVQCPFSAPALATTLGDAQDGSGRTSSRGSTRAQVENVYQLCREPETYYGPRSGSTSRSV